MGFFSKAASRVREYLRYDKEKTMLRLAQGNMAGRFPMSGYDLLQAYGYDVISDYLKLEHDLLSRFIDYEEMDDYPEIAAGVDIFADDASQPDTLTQRTLWVTSSDEGVQDILDEELLKRTLRIDEESWEIARTLTKYGQDYEEIILGEEGVIGLNFLPPPTVRRIEGPRGELFGFVQDFKGRFGYSPAEFQQILAMRSVTVPGADQSGMGGMEKVAAMEDWEVVHMRLRGKHRRSVYGYSVLEPARWIWKRLMLLEDAALVYRLQRAPERYAFYVDTGDLPPAEALAFTNRVRQQFKKRKFFNPTTGKLDLKFEPLSSDEDFFIPMRKGSESTRIEVLGSPSWQHMDDIEYFRSKLFAAIKIPKAYLGQEEGVGKSVLSSEDVRFARTVLRIQREIRNGISKVCRVHLAALNIDPYATEFDVHMTIPSAIFELAQLEVRNARADLAGRMRDFVSLYWILSNVFGLTDDQIQKVIKEREEDAVRDAENQGKGQAAMQKAAGPPPGEGGGDPMAALAAMGGGGAPAGELPPGEAPPGEAPPEAPPGEAPPEGSAPEKERAPVQAPAVVGQGPDYRKLTEESRVIPFRPRSFGRPFTRHGGISEQDLFAGRSREAEKRAEDKMDKLLRNNAQMAHRLADLGSLLHELTIDSGARAASGRRRR